MIGIQLSGRVFLGTIPSTENMGKINRLEESIRYSGTEEEKSTFVVHELGNQWGHYRT